MAVYKITTDQGTFNVTTDEPASKPANPLPGALASAVPGISGGVQAMDALSNVDPSIRRPIMQGMATVAAGNPLTGAIANAGAGQVSDAMDNPVPAAQVAAKAAQAVIDPVGVSKDILSLPADQRASLLKQGVKGGVDAVTGAVQGGMNQMIGGMDAKNAFTAGMKEPSTAIPGGVGRAGEAYNAAKAGAVQTSGKLEDAAASRFSQMLATPSGQMKLANEGIKRAEGADKMGVTELLVYRDAAGKAWGMGGPLADRFKAAKATYDAAIAAKFPAVAEASANMAKALMTSGVNPNYAFGLITSINPAVGLGRMAMASGAIKNTAGAIAGLTARAVVPAAQEAYKRLMGNR